MKIFHTGPSLEEAKISTAAALVKAVSAGKMELYSIEYACASDPDLEFDLLQHRARVKCSELETLKNPVCATLAKKDEEKPERVLEQAARSMYVDASVHAGLSACYSISSNRGQSGLIFSDEDLDCASLVAFKIYNEFNGFGGPEGRRQGLCPPPKDAAADLQRFTACVDAVVAKKSAEKPVIEHPSWLTRAWKATKEIAADSVDGFQQMFRDLMKHF